jgi:hypothetical protein
MRVPRQNTPANKNRYMNETVGKLRFQRGYWKLPAVVGWLLEITGAENGRGRFEMAVGGGGRFG